MEEGHAAPGQEGAPAPAIVDQDAAPIPAEEAEGPAAAGPHVAAQEEPKAEPTAAEPEAAEPAAAEPAAAEPEAPATAAGSEQETEEPAPETLAEAPAAAGAEEPAVEAEPAVKAEEAAAGEQPAAAGPSDEQLVARLRALLVEADLSTVTERSLRRTLEAEFGVELASRKPLIRSEIEAFLAGQAEGDGEEAEEGGEGEGDTASGTSHKRNRQRKSSGGGAGFGSRLSPEMAAFLGMESCPRTQVVKHIWAYIRENNLQDPKDKRRIILDEKLKTIFPGKTTDMFKMNKHLSKHCKTDDRAQEEEEEGSEGEGSEGGEESGDEEERPAKRQRPRKPAKRSAPSASSDGKAKKPGGFQRPVRVSDELAAWVGQSEISRPEVTKFFYAYIKEHGLHDPSNKQFVLADETLKALTGEDRIRAFGFQSLIKHHFIKD